MNLDYSWMNINKIIIVLKLMPPYGFNSGKRLDHPVMLPAPGALRITGVADLLQEGIRVLKIFYKIYGFIVPVCAFFPYLPRLFRELHLKPVCTYCSHLAAFYCSAATDIYCQFRASHINYISAASYGCIQVLYNMNIGIAASCNQARGILSYKTIQVNIS
jgi:hypothetical protein